MEITRKRYLIEFSSNIEEADSIIKSEGCETIGEKIAYLKGMFDFKLIGRYDDESITPEESQEMDYYAILSAIINNRWEG